MGHGVAKNTLYLTVASVGQKVLAFVYFLVIARVMQPEATGEYFLALSLTTIFSVLADFGLTSVVIRETAKRPESATHLMRLSIGMKLPLLLAAVASANLAAALLGYGTEIRQLVLLASFILAADAFSLLFYGVLRGFQNLRFESLGIFLGQFLTISFGGLALAFDPRLSYLVLALILGSGFNLFFSAKQIQRVLGSGVFIPAWDRGSRRLLATALPFALAAIFVKVYSYVDSILLSLFLGTVSVGIYAVAYKLTYAFQFLPLAFTAALYPGMSALLAAGERERLAKLFNDSMWYMAVLASPIVFGIWAVSEDLVQLAGGGYLEAAGVLRVLILVLLPIFLDFPIGSLLNAADRQGTKTAIMGVTMIINVILNLLFIPLYGIAGAAYAALGSFIFMFAAGLWFVPQIIKGYAILSLFLTILPIIASGAVMAAVTVLIRPLTGFVLVIPVSAVLYVALLILTRSLTGAHLAEAKRIFRRRSYEPPLASHD